MHIVLVHYLEVKVIANPTLVDIYLAICPLYFQTIGFHHPKCCIVENFMLNAFFFFTLHQVFIYYLV
jgi:hypothetical protein